MDYSHAAWDYRVLKFDKESERPDIQGYSVHEVFYSPTDKPQSFNSTPLNIAEINIVDMWKLMQKIAEGMRKPVLLVRPGKLIETKEIVNHE